jgi:hypothetical protein
MTRESSDHLSLSVSTLLSQLYDLQTSGQDLQRITQELDVRSATAWRGAEQAVGDMLQRLGVELRDGISQASLDIYHKVSTT